MSHEATQPLYRVLSQGIGVEEMTRLQVRDAIRQGHVTSATEIAPAGTDDWRSASEYPELQRYLELSAARFASEQQMSRQADLATADVTVSAKRLITYLALGGFTAGWMYALLLPLCVMIGVFGRYMLSWAIFGAVFGLAVNSAAKIENPRVIQITAAGFATGGLIALWLPYSGGYAFIQLGVIGLLGAASLGWVLGFGPTKIGTIAAAGALMFPLSLYLYQNGAIVKMVNAVVPLGLFALLLFFAIWLLPYMIFGAVVGATIVYAPER